MAIKSTRSNPLFVVLGLSFLFFLIFLGMTSYLFFNKNTSSKVTQSGPSLFTKGVVGILEVNGPIMDSKKVLARLERLEESPEVKAIVVRLNSPGGAVAPSQEIYEAIKKSSKPVVASMGNVAASGAYYIACGAKKVFANAGTITGSIGVIMEFANMRKLYEWAKVERFSIKTGKFKDSGAEYRDMAPEEKELLQGMVDNVLGQFKTAVSEGRKMSMSEVDLVADGRIFSGAQAKAAKLVDEIGTFDDAIKEAGLLGKIEGKPKVMYHDHKKKGRELLDFLMDDGSEEESRSPVSGLGVVVKLLRALGQDSNLESAAQVVSPLLPLPAGIYWIWPGTSL
jgi:protease-4